MRQFTTEDDRSKVRILIVDQVYEEKLVEDRLGDEPDCLLHTKDISEDLEVDE